MEHIPQGLPIWAYFILVILVAFLLPLLSKFIDLMMGSNSSKISKLEGKVELMEQKLDEVTQDRDDLHKELIAITAGLKIIIAFFEADGVDEHQAKAAAKQLRIILESTKNL